MNRDLVNAICAVVPLAATRVAITESGFCVHSLVDALVAIQVQEVVPQSAAVVLPSQACCSVVNQSAWLRSLLLDAAVHVLSPEFQEQVPAAPAAFAVPVQAAEVPNIVPTVAHPLSFL